MELLPRSADTALAAPVNQERWGELYDLWLLVRQRLRLEAANAVAAGSGTPLALAAVMRPALLIAAAVTLPLLGAVPEVARGRGHHLVLLVPALILLATSLAARAIVRASVPTPARIASIAGLTIWWGYFWLVDLHRAQFQVVPLVVPAALLVATAVTRSHLATALSGTAALAGVWLAMLERADNGCIGVSAAYGDTLGVTGVFLFGVTPWLVKRDQSTIRVRRC